MQVHLNQSFPNDGSSKIWAYYDASWSTRNKVQVMNNTAFYYSNTGQCELVGPADALKGKVTLLNIPVGFQHLKIVVDGFYKTNQSGLLTTGYGLDSSATIYFTISPKVTVTSIENKIYNTTELPLDFNFNSEFSEGAYSLDNHANVTIHGNTTMTGLNNGFHNLVVYAQDVNGIFGKSETVNFTVALPKEPFPTILVTGSLIAVAVIVAGLLVYFKKRKH
jgi:hypothetical protein